MFVLKRVSQRRKFIEFIRTIAASTRFMIINAMSKLINYLHGIIVLLDRIQY